MAVNSTIDKFLEVASKHDFARDNLYRVVGVNVVNGETNILHIEPDGLIFCKGGALPKRTNPVSDNVAFMGMKLPYNQSTIQYDNNYSLEFWIDRKSTVIQAFEYASRKVFDDLSTRGNWAFPTDNSYIEITALDFNLEEQETIKFYGVAFKGFDGIDTKQADGTGVAISVKCEFSYQYYVRQRGSQASKNGAIQLVGGSKPVGSDWFAK